MAQINKPSDYFNTKLYTGNGGTQSITGINFKPDWVWIKSRGDTSWHRSLDVVRGATKELYQNETSAENTEANGLTSFDSDGFSIGSNSGYNGNTVNFASWNWLAGGTPSSNTDGSITSSVSASTTSGFSIVSYTGTGSNATVGHGLGVAPSMIIVKRRSGIEEWTTYHKSIGNTKYLDLNDSGTAVTYNMWQDTDPTSSVFSITTHNRLNASGDTYIAYCFAEKKGYSKFGTYTGVLSAGATALGSPFVYTGFKPAMVILKSSSHVENWHLKDAKRDTFNYQSKALYPNLSSVEGTITNNGGVDFYSNGFGINYGTGDIGSSGKSYIYYAVAEQPLVGTNNIPATAR